MRKAEEYGTPGSHREGLLAQG